MPPKVYKKQYTFYANSSFKNKYYIFSYLKLKHQKNVYKIKHAAFFPCMPIASLKKNKSHKLQQLNKILTIIIFNRNPLAYALHISIPQCGPFASASSLFLIRLHAGE
jgi:hypothetical protein